MHPKVYWKTTVADGTTLQIKVEVNTFERSPALDHTHIHYTVDTDWWTGVADVKTFQLPELVATKIRALYTPYRPENWTPAKAEQNLREKLDKHAYRDDLRQLTRTQPTGFKLEDAIELLLTELITHIDTWGTSD